MAALDPKHNSRALTEGPHRAAARAYLKGIGYDDEALAKPIVGVKLEWVGEICLSMPKGQLERLRAKSARPRKKGK